MSEPGLERARRRFGGWPSAGACVAAALVLLACACNSDSGSATGGRVTVVDARGAPLAGAFLVLVPEDDNGSTRPVSYTSWELRDQTSDAQGVFRASLDDCLWESDGCFHFRVRKDGYEEVAMSVSKDLFPPVLRVELKPREQAPAPSGASRS